MRTPIVMAAAVCGGSNERTSGRQCGRGFLSVRRDSRGADPVMNGETRHQAVIFRLALADTRRRGARKSAQW